MSATNIIPERIIFEVRGEGPNGAPLPPGAVFALYLHRNTQTSIQCAPRCRTLPGEDGEEGELQIYAWALRCEQVKSPLPFAYLDLHYFAFETGAAVPGHFLYLSTLENVDGVDYHLFRLP
jgi:hypothetical protein